ncbi:hypothetical protein F511_36823 [Dorcoceras hygrometricum]|uniref:Uncharacterized protein n=1 Tax=Dorcoceras hygrometricum TaxID=472368 RepID=A0A2Z7A8K2_9LAMI|nr:hypothetical protein F511_36823 [Dorcoceras hygrometricum]
MQCNPITMLSGFTDLRSSSSPPSSDVLPLNLAAVDRQSGPRPESIFLRQSALEDLMDFSHERILLEKVIGTSPIMTATARQRKAARGGVGRSWGGEEEGLAALSRVMRCKSVSLVALAHISRSDQRPLVKSRVARDPIAMHTSWRSNSDIASVTRVSMTFRVVRTNQYNQDLGLIHSTNGNHLKSPNEGSSIDHQVTIHLYAQNITMFPTNETWYFTS